LTHVAKRNSSSEQAAGNTIIMATKEAGKDDVCIGRLPPASMTTTPEHLAVQVAFSRSAISLKTFEFGMPSSLAIATSAALSPTENSWMLLIEKQA
jgi:hypothetical protein